MPVTIWSNAASGIPNPNSHLYVLCYVFIFVWRQTVLVCESYFYSTSEGRSRYHPGGTISLAQDQLRLQELSLLPQTQTFFLSSSMPFPPKLIQIIMRPCIDLHLYKW